MSCLTSADAFGVIRECLDYLRTREEEQSKRAYIRAKRDALVKALESERELILTYFEHRFAGRREALHQFFQVMRESVANGNSEGLQTALHGILGIMQENPLKDLNEFRRHWEDQDFQLEL